MPVRLKDIARDLNVSTVTVSKVLRGNTDISEKTRARVLKRMQELKYQPNMLARGLASGRTYTMGLVVPDLVQPFFAEFAKSLSEVLRNHHHALLIASSEENPEIEQQEIRTLLSRGVDVLLIASCQPKLKNFYELGDERTPFLLIDRNFPYLAAHFVGSDDHKAGEMATQHLVDIGKRRIAHIGGRIMSPSLERTRGYRDALAKNGLPFDEKLVITLERFEETGDRQGYEAMKQLLAVEPLPDAVFCYNDLTAIGAMEATREAGLRIPEEIAFIGCGNMRYAPYLMTPLTSIDQGTEQLGANAGRLALQLSETPDVEMQSILLEPGLVIRRSTVVPDPR
jgi:LacI family transcriptional regulator